jgi:NADP-dependent 3-hydroxy acid dehydrogenase YdfG
MNIVILGGTSGMGLALARHYLEQGHSVCVCGRDPSRLDAGVLQAYPRLQVQACDIADKEALHRVLSCYGKAGSGASSDMRRLDLLIVTAGMYFNTRGHYLDQVTSMRMLQTNVSGLVHAFELAAGIMLEQGSGHLVAVSSVAGLLQDYPGASLYSATKRSVLSLCDTYRIALKPFGIAVTAIIPGYVDTEKLRQLNSGDASHKPFLLSEQQAVEKIAAAITQGRERCIFPWQMRWLIAVLNKLPSKLIGLRR